MGLAAHQEEIIAQLYREIYRKLVVLKVNAEGAANNVQTIELICLNTAALQRTIYLNFRCGQIQHRGFVSLHHIQLHHTAPILIDPPLNAKKAGTFDFSKVPALPI